MDGTIVWAMDYGKRYDAKRAAGLSPRRSDGSMTSRIADEEAGAAEEYAARFFNQCPNSEVYATHGDGGHDFLLRGRTVEVIHLGMSGSLPRLSGHLIVNPHEPHRHADIYVVVSGCRKTGFHIVGCLSHIRLIELPMKNFGYGPRFACHTANLRPIENLQKWIVKQPRAVSLC